MKYSQGVIDPMLAVDLEQLKKAEDYYLDNPSWGVSQKVDGRRILALHDGDRVLFLNRRGERTENLPQPLADSLMKLGGGFLLDGEFLHGTYYVFDCISTPTGGITPDSPYKERYEHLQVVLELKELSYVHLLPFVMGGRSVKANAIAHYRQNSCEGYMLRNVSSPYQFGVRSRHLIKVKFWRSLDAIVFHPGRKGKLSVGVALLDGQGAPVDVGAVTVTQANLDQIQVGDVIEVKYLYATDGGRLYQPSFLRKRDDKDAKECTIDQMLPTNRSVLSIQ